MPPRSCVSYIKYNYTGKRRDTLNDEMRDQPKERKRKFHDEVVDWENGREGTRNVKRFRETESTLNVSRKQMLEGKRREGNFWPKDLSEPRIWSKTFSEHGVPLRKTAFQEHPNRCRSFEAVQHSFK